MSSEQEIMNWLNGKTCLGCSSNPATFPYFTFIGDEVYVVPACDAFECRRAISDDKNGIVTNATVKLLVTNQEYIEKMKMAREMM